jgi:carboxylesterase
MSSEIMKGAEPYSARGGATGVLVVHGFTGNPQSMRPLAEAFAAAGFTVELPRLPGHGTSLDDMLTTTWDDWSGAAEAAYQELAARCSSVVVAGLSMGGTITAWLAARHPEIVGIVLINPAVEPAADSFMEALAGMRATGQAVMDGIGSDIADPDVKELAYEGTPLAPLESLFEATRQLQPLLSEIRCPVLLLTSVQDHVVPPSAGDHQAAVVSGPVERLWLERSYHVVTLDYDKDEVERRVVEFAQRVTGA